MTNIEIKEGPIDDVISVNSTITEFDVHFSKEEFENALRGKNSIVLVAYKNSDPIGFLCGWIDKYNNCAKSWAGAVNKNYRRKGVMSRIVKCEEEWIKKQDVNKIVVDVNQRNIPMIILLLKLKYYIIGTKYDGSPETSKVYLEKNFT